jgi:hypothetical protein
VRALPIADCQLPIGVSRNDFLKIGPWDLAMDKDVNWQSAIGNWKCFEGV